MGERYLVALIHYEGWGWAPLSHASGSLIDGAGRVTATSGASVNDALAGKTPPEVGDLLAGEAPDPVAAKYAHLDPVSRAETYLEEKHRGWPRLRIAEDDGSKTYENLHRGARALAEGLYAAIRNPGMHAPSDGGEEQLALEQLAAFSLLARWIDQAEVVAV